MLPPNRPPGPGPGPAAAAASVGFSPRAAPTLPPSTAQTAYKENVPPRTTGQQGGQIAGKPPVPIPRARPFPSAPAPRRYVPSLGRPSSSSSITPSASAAGPVVQSVSQHMTAPDNNRPPPLGWMAHGQAASSGSVPAAPRPLTTQSTDTSTPIPILPPMAAPPHSCHQGHISGAAAGAAPSGASRPVTAPQSSAATNIWQQAARAAPNTSVQMQTVQRQPTPALSSAKSHAAPASATLVHVVRTPAGAAPSTPAVPSAAAAGARITSTAGVAPRSAPQSMSMSRTPFSGTASSRPTSAAPIPIVHTAPAAARLHSTAIPTGPHSFMSDRSAASAVQCPPAAYNTSRHDAPAPALAPAAASASSSAAPPTFGVSCSTAAFNSRRNPSYLSQSQQRCIASPKQGGS